MVDSYFQRVRSQCEVEGFNTKGHKKIYAYSIESFCGHGNTVCEAMGCYYRFCPCQGALPYLTEEEVQRSIKKRELEELRKQYIGEKGYNVIEMYECDFWKKYKTDMVVEQHVRESFSYKMLQREKRLFEIIKWGSQFG